MIERVSATKLVFTGETGSHGLHTRSAAFLVRWVAGLDASVEVVRVGGARPGRVSFWCSPASAVPFVKLSALGAGPGGRLEISATGPDAERAIDGAERALSEEPPTALYPGAPYGPREQETLEAWKARITRGMPADEDLEEELHWWLCMVSKPDLTAAERAYLDRRVGAILASEA
jgi:phosphotransferase system HPr-like phosphotransfer protein